MFKCFNLDPALNCDLNVMWVNVRTSEALSLSIVGIIETQFCDITYQVSLRPCLLRRGQCYYRCLKSNYLLMSFRKALHD